MPNETTYDRLKKLRLDKMRMGQSTCEIYNLLSQPEVRFAMVPLTEAEYDQCLESSTRTEYPSTPAGAEHQSRKEAREVLIRSLREPDDLSVRPFTNERELMEVLEIQDINFLKDAYLEMIDRSSPSIDGFSDEEIEELKKAFGDLSWKDLDGKQWYALKRFLLTLSPAQLMARSLGSLSTT